MYFEILMVNTTCVASTIISEQFKESVCVGEGCGYDPQPLQTFIITVPSTKVLLNKQDCLNIVQQRMFPVTASSMTN